MKLTDQQMRHIRAMLLQISGAGSCHTCDTIRKKLAMELQFRKVRRRVIREWNQKGV